MADTKDSETTAARGLKPVAGKTILASNNGGSDRGYTEKANLLGIDLGTSRSSIVSMNGTRKTVESYVGYARDPISRKLLKADVIYGRHALDNRLAVNLFRPLEKGVIKGTRDDGSSAGDDAQKNLNAAKDLLRYMVDLVHPGRDEVLFGVIGVPSLATGKNKQAILEIAKEVLDSVMIVSEPFTVAYAMDRMSDVMVIDIGAGTTDLCRMHGTVPTEEDEISYTVAGDAIDTKLYELIMERYPKAQLTQNMCKTFKESYGFVSDAKDKVEVMIPVDGTPTPHDITKELKAACEILIPPIVEGIRKLVSSFNPEFQEKLRNNILLSGGGGMMDGLNKRIEDAMKAIGGGRVTTVEEPLYAGADGALRLAMDMPGEYWQQLR
ncbi:MAG: rod shape-determining protein MreB [Phycisphaerales bacterium]|jgi:rod shape-determining protein MreB|nr:rod shape-determining protein MreB [Phycisphaerales bacterium]